MRALQLPLVRRPDVHNRRRGNLRETRGATEGRRRSSVKITGKSGAPAGEGKLNSARVSSCGRGRGAGQPHTWAECGTCALQPPTKIFGPPGVSVSVSLVCSLSLATGRRGLGGAMAPKQERKFGRAAGENVLQVFDIFSIDTRTGALGLRTNSSVLKRMGSFSRFFTRESDSAQSWCIFWSFGLGF